MAHTVVAMKQFSLILKNLCKQASSLRTYKLCSTFSKLATPCISQVADTSDPTLLQLLNDDLVVKNSFITDTEESSILAEINPYMSRLRYEYDHWDDAIHGYRETERSSWNEANTQIINRVRQTSFPYHQTMPHIHILDIEAKGYIKPHVDSVRYCGDTISGLSLLSDSVMRFVSTSDKNMYIDVLLKRLSLYIIRGKARYDFTHELLPDETSYFKGVHIPRHRRISVICRNPP